LPGPQRDLTFGELVLLVLQRKWQFVGLMVLGLALGIVVSKSLLKKKYQAQASFIGVGSTRLTLPAGLGSLGALAGQLGFGGLGGGDASFSPYFYADLIKTDTILSQLANVQVPDSADPTAPPTRLRVLLKIGGKSHADSVYRAARRLRGMIVVDIRTRTGVIKVTFTARRPYIAAIATDTLLGLVNGFVTRDLRSRAGSTRRFLEDRLAQIDSERSVLQNRLRTFLEGNREYRNSPSLLFRREELQRDVDLKRDLYLSVARSLEEARMNEARDTPLLSVIDRPTIPTRPSGPHAAKNGLMLAMLLPLLWLTYILVQRVNPVRQAGGTASR
jgi:uncharacterized protein involved in exopolysaccharide biosynthesis